MSVPNKISTLVKNQFPDFYKEDGENFLAFIEAYYEYMEQSGKLTGGIQNLQDYRNIDTTLDEYIEYFRRDFLPSIPIDVQADKSLMVKYIKFFNNSRGTLASYKLLFRAIYNEDIDVDYPAEHILKVSESDWRIDRYLVTDYNTKNYTFIGKSIIGSDSRATALVENVVRRTIRGRDLMQIYLSNIVGTFGHLEPIRLVTDTNSTGFIPNIEAGINKVTVDSAGGEYAIGDIIKLESNIIGDFAKVVVTSVSDFAGALTFTIADGGSGYRGSTVSPGSKITFSTVTRSSDASFIIEPSDIVDTNSLLMINVNLFTDTTIFGTKAPLIVNADGVSRLMSDYSNTILSSPDFGFPETVVFTPNQNFRENANAVIGIANTRTISVGQSIYGATSGANGIVKEIVSSAANNGVFRVDTYKNFSTTEVVKVGTSAGSAVGNVVSFSSNTIGHHILSVGNVVGQTISTGDELVGRTSGAFGVVKKVVADTANGYVQGVGGADDRNLVVCQVTANTTANLTSQFSTGPMRAFIANESLRLVGANTTIGNVSITTSNSQIENIYTSLDDSFLFPTYSVGTIAELSLVNGGLGYFTAPNITVADEGVRSMDIGEYYITIQSDNVNWGTGNSFFTILTSDDRIIQTTSGSSGYVVGGSGPGLPIAVNQYANGTYESVVRVWQDMGNRTTDGKTFANNVTTLLKTYAGSYIPGYTNDTRTLENTGAAKIVKIVDEGILGTNANINANVGANGAISGIRILDSGFSYKDGESVTIASSGRSLSTAGVGTISLRGDANSEGYYATSKGHLSSKRGYLQDGEYYQEFSYEIISALSLNKYKDVALKLVHPSGQRLYGKYSVQSNVSLDIIVTSNNKKRLRANGSISITNSTFNVTGTGTQLTSSYANGDTLMIEYGNKQFYSTVINIVSSNTVANLNSAWTKGTISGANVYYTSGTI